MPDGKKVTPVEEALQKRIADLEQEIEERGEAYQALQAEFVAFQQGHPFQPMARVIAFARTVATCIPSSDSSVFRGAWQDLRDELRRYDHWLKGHGGDATD